MQLADTSWPRFRANPGGSGKSSHSGPKGTDIIWTKKLGKINGEPSIGLDGTIYLPRDEELVAISLEGEIEWKKSIFGHRNKPLRGTTTPAVRNDGTIVVGTLRKVTCLEPDGSERWHHMIDGIPFGPNIGPQGRIYVSAWSIDWAGIYVISPEGNPTGHDDPKIFERWVAHRSLEVTPPAIDKEGNVYVAFHTNFTHPEAYTWDPPDEVDEEFFYACSIFNPDGERIGKFVPWIFKSWRHNENSVCVDSNGTVFYQGSGTGEMYAFTLDNILSTNIPEDKDFLRHFYLYESTKAATDRVKKFQEDTIMKCTWTWDKYRDEDEEGNKGPLYQCELLGYPAPTEESTTWMRVSKRVRTANHPEPFPPSNRIVRMDSSKVPTDNLLHHDVFDLSGPIRANPIIDSRGFVYIGTKKGRVHVQDKKGKKVRVIGVGHPIESLVIGPEESLVACSKARVSLVK